MFILNYLYNCYKKQIYLIVILILLDILSSLYSGGIQHPLTRHMFISYDLVSGFSNILYWIILFIPIGIDIVQEKGDFGVLLFYRISKLKYMFKKSIAIFLYCILFFALTMIISYFISFINKFETGLLDYIIKEYILLVLLSYLTIIFVYFVAWLFNSICIMTIVYVGLITAMQIPYLQGVISINNLMNNLFQSVLLIIAGMIILLIMTIFVMQQKDCIGVKKGMTI